MNDQFDQLVAYIKQNLSQGTPEDRIRQTLLQHNWSAELVDKAFLLASTPQAPAQQSQANVLEQELVDNAQAAPQDVHEYGGQANTNPVSPVKYKVFRAIGDTFQAVGKNAPTFFMTAFMSYAFAGVALFMLVLLVGVALFSGTGLFFASPIKLLTILFGTMIFYTAWFTVTNAFILSTTSLALYDGSINRKSSLSTIMSQAFSRLSRVIVANILFSLVVFWPTVLISLLPFILLASGEGAGNSVFFLMPLAVLLSIGWVTVTLLRFALVPYVALFEPDVPLLKTLGRSNHLLRKGGQWFLVKGFLLVFLVVLVLSAVTGQNIPEVANSNNVVSTIAIFVISALVNGALVMLYRNRKTIKG